jgi:hypothetical protein
VGKRNTYKPKLRLPSCPRIDTEGDIKYYPIHFRQRLVYEYSGIDFKKQEEINLVEFLAIARDAYVSQLNKTEEGQEYLNRCWIAEQTKPDRAALKAHFDVKEA